MAKCDIHSLPNMEEARNRTTKFDFEYENVIPSDDLKKYAYRLLSANQQIGV